MNKKNTLNCPKSAAMGFFSKGLKNEFEIAMVNEPSVFEPLKFYCIPTQHSDFFQAFPSSFFSLKKKNIFHCRSPDKIGNGGQFKANPPQFPIKKISCGPKLHRKKIVKIDSYLIILSSKTYVFEDKLTQY